MSWHWNPQIMSPQIPPFGSRCGLKYCIQIECETHSMANILHFMSFNQRPYAELVRSIHATTIQEIPNLKKVNSKGAEVGLACTNQVNKPLYIFTNLLMLKYFSLLFSECYCALQWWSLDKRWLNAVHVYESFKIMNHLWMKNVKSFSNLYIFKKKNLPF